MPTSLGDVGVAEAVEAARLHQPLGDVQDARRAWPRRRALGANSCPPCIAGRSCLYLLVGRQSVNGGGSAAAAGQTHANHRAQDVLQAGRDARVPARPCRDPQDRRGRGRPAGVSARLALVERRQADRRHAQLHRPALPVPRERAAWPSAWTTAPSSSPAPATSLHCPAVTTPGSSATSRSWSSTGTARATTPSRADGGGAASVSPSWPPRYAGGGRALPLVAQP